jgi:hypothetical protein
MERGMSTSRSSRIALWRWVATPTVPEAYGGCNESARPLAAPKIARMVFFGVRPGPCGLLVERT